MLLVIWWMYDGYAWLTNAISIDRVRIRLLLIGGMGGFLVVALAVPTRSTAKVCVRSRIPRRRAPPRGHVRARDVDDGDARDPPHRSVQLRRRDAPARGRSARRRLAVGAVDPRRGSALAHTASHVDRFVVTVSHFVERHGLVVIIALGESIVVVGAGAAGLPLDEGLVLVALLALGLSAALWWVYFSDEEAVERAFHDTPPERRPQLAVTGFGYWHYGILLAIVAVAAGLKKAIAHPYDPLDNWIARARRRRGAVHPLRRRLPPDVRARTQSDEAGCRGGRTRHHPARRVGAYAQVAAIVVVVAAALAAESLAVATVRSGGHRSPGRGAP